MKNLWKTIFAVMVGTALIMAALVGISVYQQTMKSTKQTANKLLVQITDRNAELIETKIRLAEDFVDQLEVDALNGFSLDAVKNQQGALKAHENLIVPLVRNAVAHSKIKSGWLHFDPKIVGGTLHVSYYYDKRGVLTRTPEYDIYKTGRYKEEWYLKPMKGQSVWTSPFYWDMWDEVLISYAKPMKQNGRILGVVGTDLYLADVIKELQGIRVYKSGYVILFDQDGNTLYHPEQISTKTLVTPQNDATFAFMLKEIRNKNTNSGILEDASEGRDKIICYEVLSNGWVLGAVPYVDEIYEDQLLLGKKIILITLIGLLISIGFAFLLGRRVSKPFVELNHSLIQKNKELLQKNQEIDEQRKELDYYANNDTLTGIPNRRAGLFHLQKLTEWALRSHSPLSIVYIDVDHLKRTNDSLGHNSGDQMISYIAKTISSHIREADLVCRLGGDEFLVILPGCDAVNARNIIDNIRGVARREQIYHEFPISFSAGIAEYPTDPEQKIEIEEFIRRADIQMYQDKLKRRGQD